MIGLLLDVIDMLEEKIDYQKELYRYKKRQIKGRRRKQIMAKITTDDLWEIVKEGENGNV